MAGILQFEDIESWKAARELARLVYRLTAQRTFTRDFGLRDQICRAAVSAMSNIAEGFESRTDSQFLNYLGHAKGSAAETRSPLYVALDQGYISQEQFVEAEKLAKQVSRHITGFMRYLDTHPRAVREEAPEYVTGL